MTDAVLTQPSETATETRSQGAPIWYELMVPDPAAVREFYRAVIDHLLVEPLRELEVFVLLGLRDRNHVAVDLHRQRPFATIGLKPP